MPTTAPMKCLRVLDPLASFPAAPEATRGQRMAVFHLGEKACGDLRSQLRGRCESRFFFRCFGRAAPDRMVLRPYFTPPCIMGPTFAPLPAEGPETYARERNPGRGSAGRAPQVLPPAGPSHLTPSSPGEAKSRSREAPRCPSQLLASLTRKWPPGAFHSAHRAKPQ